MKEGALKEFLKGFSMVFDYFWRFFIAFATWMDLLLKLILNDSFRVSQEWKLDFSVSFLFLNLIFFASKLKQDLNLLSLPPFMESIL